MSANCIFCKGAIPSHKVFENELVYAFMDINPISKGHLVIPKHHAQFMHELPDESLAALLPAAKKVATALHPANYNVLQNNGRLAHQAVDHVHFHIIPKTESEGLGIEWEMQPPNHEELAAIAKDLSAKIARL
ncbi:HIT-like domain-containing protein [Entophlyctis helioformis]|nr:HIT-like domain-containing protein [Entophlyctis helioformis]